ncbi:MAG: hypothetical protein V1777_04420 [Candidatus Micrarchaeota archaeon]
MAKLEHYFTRFSEISKFYKERKGKYAAEKVIPPRQRDLTKFVERVNFLERDDFQNEMEFECIDYDFWEKQKPLLKSLIEDIVERPVELNLKKIQDPFKKSKWGVQPAGKAPLVLFSGGLDSFLSAYENPNAVLVHVNIAKGMHPYAKKSREFLPLTQPYFEISFTAYKPPAKAGGVSSCRGLTFICLTSLLIPAFNADRIIIGENGILIHNPPLFEGAKMTRGLRPTITSKIEQLLCQVYEKKINLEFPNNSLTKTQVIEKIMKTPPWPEILPKTSSCFHQQPHRGIKKKIPMCGVCYACIVRQLGTLALGVDESKNYLKNPFKEWDSKGNGLMFVIDLCRLIKLYKKGLLSVNQANIILQNKALFERYFDEVLKGLKEAQARKLTGDFVDNEIAELAKLSPFC